MKLFATIIIIGSAIGAWMWHPAQSLEQISGGSVESSVAQVATGEAFAGGIPWKNDIELARMSAAESDKPLVILFTAPRWSAPCQLMNEDVFSKKDFESVSDGYEWVRMFVPISPPRGSATFATLKEYDVWSLPTIVVIDPVSGQHIKEYSGYMPGGPAAFSDWLTQ